MRQQSLLPIEVLEPHRNYLLPYVDFPPFYTTYFSSFFHYLLICPIAFLTISVNIYSPTCRTCCIFCHDSDFLLGILPLRISLVEYILPLKYIYITQSDNRDIKREHTTFLRINRIIRETHLPTYLFGVLNNLYCHLSYILYYHLIFNYLTFPYGTSPGDTRHHHTRPCATIPDHAIYLGILRFELKNIHVYVYTNIYI